MTTIAQSIEHIKLQLNGRARLVAVSKTKPIEAIQQAYNCGQREFGENYVQELMEKHAHLPEDTIWHLIGHLQTNKVKYIAPFVHWIHAVDSEKLLKGINKQASKHQRTIHCLLQMHIAQEDTKFGFSSDELEEFCKSFRSEDYPFIQLNGLMGMASFTDDTNQIRSEFQQLKKTFDRLQQSYFQGQSTFNQISMGMSSDWQIALEEGSTLVRIGSAIFGHR